MIWYANPVFAQKAHWNLFQPNNQGVHLEFGNSGCTQGSNYFKPLKPYSNQPFLNYLSINSQTDKNGKILFYVLSTIDSVYLYNSNNICISVFPGYDISPTIVPLPGGIKYHLLVGTRLYWFNLGDLLTPRSGVFDFQFREIIGDLKINKNPKTPKYRVLRAIKILRSTCDTVLYRVYSVEGNQSFVTGRIVRARDVQVFGNELLNIKDVDSKPLISTTNNYSNIDLDLDYSISEIEISPNQNELLFTGRNSFLKVDISNSYFGAAKKTWFTKDSFVNDSGRFFCGVEYVSDSTILFSQFQIADSVSANQGLYLYNILSDSFYKIPNSNGFKYSYIEKGSDGNIYLTKGDGLYKFNRNSKTISKIIQLSLVASLPLLRLVTNEINTPEVRVFSLPNSIDNYNSETLKDFGSVATSFEIKSPKVPGKQIFKNTGHKLTEKGSGEIFILDSLIITNIAGWVVFDSMTIQFAEGSFLKIIGGSDLELKGTKLMGTCGNMWNGVEIVQNGTQKSRLICRKNSQGRSTTIRDALIAVVTRSSNHGIKTSDSTLFIANKVGMKISNGELPMYNITNTFFIDSLMLLNGEKSQIAIDVDNSAIKIGHKDSLPIVVVGGRYGISVNMSKSIELQNINFIRTKDNAVGVTSTDIIVINNTKTQFCKLEGQAGGAIFIDGFRMLDFRKNIINHNSVFPALLINSTLGSKIKIGGLISDSNRIVYNGQVGISINAVSNNFYKNSNNRSFEVFNRPLAFVPFPYFTLAIENNRIIGKGPGTGIDVIRNVNKSIGIVYFDTLIISNNKLDVQNGICLTNVCAKEQNKILPMRADWLLGNNKRHIYGNKINLKQYDIYRESYGVLLHNTDHIYCVGNTILNKSKSVYSLTSEFCQGIKLIGASNTLIHNDSLLDLYGGVEIYGSNNYSNIYCNYFFNNRSSIKLLNSELRQRYSNMPPATFNQKVHGMNLSPTYIARSNTFLGIKFFSSIFHNDKLSQPDYCKWILEPLTLSSPYLLSNPKKRDFIFNLNGSNSCGQFMSNPNALDNKDFLNAKDAVINPVELFWNNYFNTEYNIIHANSSVNPSFFSDLVALELAIDTGSLSQIETSFFNLNPTDTIQAEIKKVFGFWLDYISHYDTFYRGDNKIKSLKIWDNDTTWHTVSGVVDTVAFNVKYRSQPDSVLLFLETISKYSPFHKRPASFFARNLMHFMGLKFGFTDSLYLDLVPITGRVTGNCFGGGVQGIVVKLFDEYNSNTGIYAVTETAGYFRFSGDELKDLDTNKRYYVRAYLSTDSNHISVTAKIANLQNDSLLNIDCVFPGPQPLGDLFYSNSRIKCIPNPGDNILMILGLENNMVEKLQIYDALGSLVTCKISVHNIGSKLQLDVTDLLDGVYYLRLESKGELFSTKIIIQH